ncbi:MULTISPECIES: hypothetical protein [Empedobacter]|uniref:hypothetical protein n=1 Tax=Empedobacter TaxID=59734 RepID=UPI002577FD1A|nr:MULTISPECIES: hypothetical protein [Empedobacter]MDM1042116.1 hypothetical protein [Empedobacter brevis]MDM1136009.1 hypothetical protein [Empedobacter sp. R750]
MKQLCIFLSLLIGTLMYFSNCATKRKTKDVEQVKVESEKSIVNDSSVNLQLQKSTYDYLQNYSKNETLLQKLGLTYAGKTNEDKGKVSLKQTENGLELDIQGAIAMALEKEQSKDENISFQKVISLVDSVYSVRLQQDLKQREQRLIDSFKSNTEKEKTDVSIWIYVLIGVVISLVIFFAWLNNQINKLNKIGGK